MVRTLFFWSFILLDFYPFLLIFSSSSYSRDNIYINKCFSKFVVCLLIFLSYFFLSCKVFNFYGVRFNICFTESGFRIIVREISYIQVIIIQLYLLFILVWFCFLHWVWSIWNLFMYIMLGSVRFILISSYIGKIN